MEFREEQFLNAWSEMLVTLVGITTLSKLPQYWNAYEPMFVTLLLGMLILVKLPHRPNALDPIVVTLGGIPRLDMLV
jgi:hypothetical protein